METFFEEFCLESPASYTGSARIGYDIDSCYESVGSDIGDGGNVFEGVHSF